MQFSVIIEKAQSGQRGTFMPLIFGAFILSHLGPYGDDGTGRLSRGPFSLPLKGHSEGQWKHIFWLRKRAFPSILSPNAARVRVRAAVNLDPHRAVTVTVVHEWTT